MDRLAVGCALSVALTLGASAIDSDNPAGLRMLERAWAEIDSTTAIQVGDSVATRTGPDPRAAAPESLRTLARLLAYPRGGGLIGDHLDCLPELLTLPTPSDTAAQLPTHRRVMVLVRISPLGVPVHAETKHGPRDRWVEALRTAMSTRWKPARSDSSTFALTVQVPL